ncbi:MAG: hypothetical protein AAF641_16285 [Pseudomonadota bacterium]
MDPKFGGPYGWSVFIRIDFWILAILPSIHYAAVIYALRFRWRKLCAGDPTYQHLEALAGPILFLVAGGFLYAFGVHEDVTYLLQTWLRDVGVGPGSANTLTYLAPLYLALFFLTVSVSGRAWIIAAGIFFGLGLLTTILHTTLTHREVSEVEGGRLHSHVTPLWVQFLSTTLSFVVIALHLAALVYTILHLIFWSLSWTLPVRRSDNLPPVQEKA